MNSAHLAAAEVCRRKSFSAETSPHGNPKRLAPRFLRERGGEFSALRLPSDPISGLRTSRCCVRRRDVAANSPSCKCLKVLGSVLCLIRNPDPTVLFPPISFASSIKPMTKPNRCSRPKKNSSIPLSRSMSTGFRGPNQKPEFATTIASKLVAARSIPDVTSLYQDLLGQRMQRCVEDSNHVFADAQKLLRTGSRLAQSGNGG